MYHRAPVTACHEKTNHGPDDGASRVSQSNQSKRMSLYSLYSIFRDILQTPFWKSDMECCKRKWYSWFFM